RRQAPLQAPAQPAAAAQALLTPRHAVHPEGRSDSPLFVPEAAMSLKSRVVEDMKTAMRAKDAARLSTIRMLLAAIKQREVDERIELADADVLAIIDKMMKQRRDSIAQFEAGKRDDLAAVERAEIAVLEGYMPARLSDAELDALIADAIVATGAA